MFEFIRWNKIIINGSGSCIVLRGERIYMVKILDMIIDELYDITDQPFSKDLPREKFSESDAIELGLEINKYL